MWERIKDEPALLVGVVTAIITLLVTFGVPISADQKTAVVGLVSAVLMLAGAGVVRGKVKPTRKLDY